MFWMRAYTLRGEVGVGWALEFPSFLGPVKWERADRRVPFWRMMEEMCAAAGIPVSGPSTLPNSVDIQQRIEPALSSVPGLQASNLTVNVCVISNNHGSVSF
jgi:hypothetical protein